MVESNSKDLFGRLMLSIEGTSLSNEDKALISNPHVGGIIFFSKNFISRNQISDLCNEIKSIKKNIILAVDHEGGRVQRFKDGFTKIPTMQSLGDFSIKNSNSDICNDVGWLMSSELMAAGIDISFAPVLDIDRDTSSIIGNRAFSDNPRIVSKLASNFIDGMNEAGMKATGKHFPGHGGVFEDSHLLEPVDNRSYTDLLEKDLIPFVDLKNKLSGIMSAHITFPNIDKYCVGYSSFWLKKILREEINFEGIIFSDDLSMKGAGEENFQIKAQKSLDAGCDMILVCNNISGASEVIKYFEKKDISLTKSISKLKPSKKIQWTDLEDDQRRLKVQATLKQIGDER